MFASTHVTRNVFPRARDMNRCIAVRSRGGFESSARLRAIRKSRVRRDIGVSTDGGDNNVLATERVESRGRLVDY